MAARLRAILICFLLALPVPGQAQMELPAAEARVLAAELLAAGNAQAAREIAIVLLRQDETDYGMLITLARADRALGRYDTATWAAIRAWETAATDKERYAAARVRAQVLSSAGNRTMAQVWLRRAAQIAPDEERRAIAIRDFRYVKSRNPLSTRLSFGARPSSNINNGSKSDTMVIGGLPFRLGGAARALSGVELSYGIETEYRQRVSETAVLRYGLSVEGRNYILSSEAKRQAPTARAEDFAYGAVELRFGGSFAELIGDGTTHFDLAVGRNWYGGDALSDFVRATVTQDVPLGDRDLLRLSLSGEDQARKDNAIRSSTAVTTRGTWIRRMEGGQLSFGLGWRETMSDSRSVAHSAALASAAYMFAEPVMGMRPTLSVNLEDRDYAGSAFGMARQDQRATLGLSLHFVEIDYFGFAPVLDLTMERNWSNIAIFDTEGLGLSLGVRSVF